ncbi:hypothetical protein JCM8202_005450 [Rhodotorula sphaerocarpa]
MSRSAYRSLTRPEWHDLGPRSQDEESRTALSRSVSPADSAAASLLRSRRLKHSRRRTCSRLGARRGLLLLVVTLTIGAVFEKWTRSTRATAVDLAYLFRSKLLDRALNERWTSWAYAPLGLRATPCSLRKEPLVFVRGERAVVVVWETNSCSPSQDWRLRWRQDAGSTTQSHVISPDQLAWQPAPVRLDVAQAPDSTADARIVHTAELDLPEDRTHIEYEIRLITDAGRSSRLRRNRFLWLGQSGHRDPEQPETLHLACVADNQFNVRTFRRILLRVVRYGRSLPASYFPSTDHERRPHVLLHAGDVVQTPDNAAQWQTDFWDVLTRGGLPFPLGQETPLLLAPGNHDWDETGRNAWTGGPGVPFAYDDRWRDQVDEERARRGTYYAYSPHRRMRIVVLDSNLPTEAEQLEQERWLAWQLGLPEWQRASLKIAVVHTAPWIEWWERRAWTEGGESRWSAYVRRRLIPQLSRADCALVLSGHSHAYTRGFVPRTLLPHLAQVDNSSSVSAYAAEELAAKPWVPPTAAEDRSKAVTEPGLVTVTFGGAGGTLDEDRVEDWRIMDRSVSGRYHFGWLAVSFGGGAGDAGKDGAAAAEGPVVAAAREAAFARAVSPDVRVYHAKRAGPCPAGQRLVTDALEWRAVGLEGDELDRFFLVGDGCM